MKTLKYSRQRESIKANLMSRHDHPTADALYASIREEFPSQSWNCISKSEHAGGDGRDPETDLWKRPGPLRRKRGATLPLCMQRLRTGL